MINARAREEANPVDIVIAEYFDAVDSGQTIEVDEFISRHEGLRDELTAFFEAADAIESLAGPTLLEVSRISSSADTSAIDNTHSAPTRRLEHQRPELQPGSMFGRYEITSEIGRGAMGSVYLAYDRQLARNVALKIPVFDGQREPEMIQRFYREARVASTIRSPNICPVFDVDQIDNIHYITMAFIEGETLSQCISSHQSLTPHRVAKIIQKIALALQKTHENGVIHRDLKPSNIMIDREGEPVVMDFGLARAAEKDDARATEVGAVIGSPAYMSPEQIAGDDQRTGPASDVYSLGVIMYQMLTGELPHRGSVLSVLGQVVSHAPIPRAALDENADLELARICETMMAKRLDRRFPDMKSVAAALESYLQGEPPVRAVLAPQPVKPPKELPASNTFHMVPIIAGLVLVVLLMAGAAATVGYLMLAKNPETAQKAKPDRNKQGEDRQRTRATSPSSPAPDNSNAGDNAQRAVRRPTAMRYDMRPGAKFGYAIKIEAARDKHKETLQGTLFYEVIDTKKGEARLRFDSRLLARNNSANPMSILSYPRVSDSFPTFREIVGAFPKHELVVGQHGDVVENQCTTQLPFALGNIGQLPIVSFGDASVDGKTRHSTVKVKVYRDPPAPRFSRLTRSPEMENLEVEKRESLEMHAEKGNAPLIEATYQITASDKQRFSAKGSGEIEFDKKSGLISRRTMSLTVLDQGQAVEITVECTLLGDSQLAAQLEKLETEPNEITGEHREQIDALKGPLAIPPDITVTQGTALNKDDILQASRGGMWRDVKVLDTLDDGRVKIHWIGFGAELDEIVPRSRLRLPPKIE